MKLSNDEIISALGGETAVFPESFICPNCGSVQMGGGFVGSEGPTSPSHNVPFGTIRCAGCGRFWTPDALSGIE